MILGSSDPRTRTHTSRNAQPACAGSSPSSCGHSRYHTPAMSQQTPSATSQTASTASPAAAASSVGGITAGQMSLVLDVSRMLAVTADLDLLLHAIAQAVTALLNCERASIFL